MGRIVICQSSRASAKMNQVLVRTESWEYTQMYCKQWGETRRRVRGSVIHFSLFQMEVLSHRGALMSGAVTSTSFEFPLSVLLLLA
jgi:hypothetical protein